MKRGELNERVNCYNIQDYMKDDKDLRRYLKSYYNYNRPIITKKKFEDIWFFFKEDCINKPMNNTIFFIIKNIKI